jgi:hypothetical protein
MGEIIAFKPYSGSARRRRVDEATAAPARILFFTGVRYSRLIEPEAALDASQSGAPPAGGVGGGRRRRRG